MLSRIKIRLSVIVKLKYKVNTKKFICSLTYPFNKIDIRLNTWKDIMYTNPIRSIPENRDSLKTCSAMI